MRVKIRGADRRHGRPGAKRVRATAGCSSLSRTPAVRSPEVHPDRRVTFRIYAPRASEVTVSGEFEVGAPAHKMTKDAQGVWSVTVGPFEPENYGYDFLVDGVQMLDPRNPVVKYNRGPAAISSLLDIPGTSPRAFDVRPVPHGKVDMRTTSRRRRSRPGACTSTRRPITSG